MKIPTLPFAYSSIAALLVGSLLLICIFVTVPLTTCLAGCVSFGSSLIKEESERLFDAILFVNNMIGAVVLKNEANVYT